MPVSLSVPFEQLHSLRSPPELCCSSGILGTADVVRGAVVCGLKAERSLSPILLTMAQRWQDALGQLRLRVGPWRQKKNHKVAPNCAAESQGVMPPSEGRPTGDEKTHSWNNFIHERTKENKGNGCFQLLEPFLLAAR